MTPSEIEPATLGLVALPRIEPIVSSSHLLVLTTQKQWLELLDPEGMGTAISRNVGDILPVDTASHPVRLESA
jgi:hypothetical protein